MPAVATQPEVTSEAFASIAKLQQLSLEAGLSDDLGQLVFRILNRSIIYCRYHRAVLWRLDGQGAKLLGVSGNVDVHPQSALVDEWRRVVRATQDRDTPAILRRQDFADRPETWDALAARTKGLTVAWLPIKVGGRTVAVLWLERWGPDDFSAGELARLEALVMTYGVAWRSVEPARRRLISRFLARRGTILGSIALLVTALSVVRLPLRIVAACEVVPRDPVAVTAPLNGVIDEMVVLPGRPVRTGELLAVYDKRVATEEMEVARKQVEIVESDLQRARAQAFEDPAQRSAVVLLENRLEQEKVRLQVVRQRFEQLEIRAPADGALMFDNPQQWRGRPVQVGERLVMIVEPARTKLRVWLPDSDNIDFDWASPVKVILDSDPSISRSARLQFLSNCSERGADGGSRFRAEAEWLNAGPALRMGLQGTAVLYGGKVSLGYLLLRRPLSAVRRYLGI